MRIAVALVAFIAAVANAATYEVDSSHSTAGFSVKHMMVTNVHGSFKTVNGTVEYDPKNPSAARVDVTIDAASIDTDNAKRDNHLRSADFFDVAKYPAITFKSKSVQKSSAGAIVVKGDLTMHGVTREIVLTVDELAPEVKDASGAARIGASAHAKINRRDYGVLWDKRMDGGGLVVSDEVNIRIDVELVRKPAAAQTSDGK